MHVAICGAVQGVGFRPFVFRLASDMQLPGWVLNSPQGVILEVEGKKEDLEGFLLRLEREKPEPAFIQSLEFTFLDPLNLSHFEILESEQGGTKSTLILPDIATCPACLSEIFDPQNRRYLYPFTNCTHCGPRFTIIEALPYDRPNTSMKSFNMCSDCQSEYDDPKDRRFHAQPTACHKCGPRLELWDSSGKVLSLRHDALLETAQEMLSGKIVAVKGLGGFHLVADARNAQAVETLRMRKRREEKPFAIMFPSVDQIRESCRVSPLEMRLFNSPESPIVLLERKEAGGGQTVAGNVAPRNPYLGTMVPYTPLHHLLMKEVGVPIIATSGNLSDEPICTDETEALDRLSGIADLFLIHNRPIVRHADDSIVRVIMDRELVLRRARGYAPLPVRCTNAVSKCLAVGAHLKSAIALSVGENVFISQHIGDLENKESLGAFEEVIQSFRRLYQVEPVKIVSDMHPDYLSTRFAQGSGFPVVQIQHHYAHVAACMAENELKGPALGVCWDGTGYGTDGTVWGGEFILAGEADFTRLATFRKFRLPGGTAAIKEPRRTALGALFEILGDEAFSLKTASPLLFFTDREISVLAQMLKKGIQSPWTSSVGRLFDVVASLSGLRQQINFEGQAAMELEFCIGSERTEEWYPFIIRDVSKDQVSAASPPLIVDWEPSIRSVIEDIQREISLARISNKFHNTLVESIVEMARRITEQRVALTGGCFQNRYLLERSVQRLKESGFKPYWHQRVPPNDGGIALGQIAAASKLLNKDQEFRQ
jgi:hydrogenase maturation protein HypF